MLTPISDSNSVSLDDYNIHVIASVLKQWLRDLPNPLMTFELYEEFLRATGIIIVFQNAFRQDHIPTVSINNVNTPF